MDEFTAVENYLRHSEYPDGLPKGEKANLRHKCHRNFKFEAGILYYKRTKSTTESAPEDPVDCSPSLLPIILLWGRMY